MVIPEAFLKEKVLGIFLDTECVSLGIQGKVYGVALKTQEEYRNEFFGVKKIAVHYTGFHLYMFVGIIIPLCMGESVSVGGTCTHSMRLCPRMFKIPEQGFIPWDECLTSPNQDIRKTTQFFFSYNLVQGINK